MPDLSNLGMHGKSLNSNYYPEILEFTFFHRLGKAMRLSIVNTGKVVANDVRIEIELTKGNGVDVSLHVAAPEKSKREYDSMLASIGTTTGGAVGRRMNTRS